MSNRIPRDKENDYTNEMAQARRDYATEKTGANLEHVGSYSFDPAVTAGNSGKAYKLAEIIGGVVLAGELSLSSAVLAGDWVTSHDALGRNR